MVALRCNQLFIQHNSPSKPTPPKTKLEKTPLQPNGQHERLTIYILFVSPPPSGTNTTRGKVSLDSQTQREIPCVMRRSYCLSLPNWKSQQQPTAYWTIIYGIRWSGPENNRILPTLNTHPPERSIAQQYHLLHCHQKQEIANSKKDCNTTTTEQH